MSFSQTAMLVSLNVRCYSARKEDKKISAEVAANHATTSDAGRYNKTLVSKTSLERVVRSASAMRVYHYVNTLPWLDEGVRILPAANYQTYKSEMESLRDEYESAVRDFVRNWPATVADARRRLNGMFNANDYPADVENRFGCRVRFMPISDAGDFRVSISDLERETLKTQIADTLSEASRAAMRDLWERLSVSVKTMASKLAAYKRTDDGIENPFRDSLVENLRELCRLLPRLNFTNDSQLEAIRAQIESELLANDAEDLRESDITRAAVAAKAQAIADSISEFMV